MGRRSRLQGNFKLRRTLRNIHQTMPNEVKAAMERGADLLLRTMRDNIPKDTGEGAAALRAFVSKSGLDARVGLLGKKANRKFYYLRFLEYGTKGYMGKKRSGNRNARPTNKTDGKAWFGKAPEIPARPAHPWLRPAFDVCREIILADIQAAVTRTLKRASEGGSSG